MAPRLAWGLLQPGHHVLVRHRGETEWHERVVTALHRYPEAVCLTPNEDHYLHDFEADIEEVALLGPRRGVPAEIRRKKDPIIMFEKAYSPNQLARALAEGDRLLREELATRSAPRVRLRGKQPLLPITGEAGARRSAGGGSPPGVEAQATASGGAASEHLWVLAEPLPEYEIGLDVTELLVRSSVAQGHGLVLVGGRLARAEHVAVKELAAWQERRVLELQQLLGIAADGVKQELEDARILPVERDHQGHRRRGFASGVQAFSEQDFGEWGLEGPRTVRYCYGEICKNGMGPISRFEKWKHENKATADDYGLDILDLVAEVAECAVTVDQLDVSNLECFERLERRRQFVEEVYRQRAEETKLTKSKDPTSITEQAFYGRPKMAGGAIIDPRLLAHVSKKAQEESELLRQQRKALEARGMTPGKGGGRGK